MTTTKSGSEDAYSVIAVLQQQMYANIKVVICDNEPSFTIKRLQH